MSTGAILAILPVLLAGAGGPDEAAIISAQRSYSCVSTELDVTPPRVNGVTYGNGNLWVGVSKGELWVFNSSGKVEGARHTDGVDEPTRDLDHQGHPKGTPMLRTLYFIDFIDLVTGELSERLDVFGLKEPGIWAGCRGEDLVFLSYGPLGAAVNIASAR